MGIKSVVDVSLLGNDLVFQETSVISFLGVDVKMETHIHVPVFVMHALNVFSSLV